MDKDFKKRIIWLPKIKSPGEISWSFQNKDNPFFAHVVNFKAGECYTIA